MTFVKKPLTKIVETVFTFENELTLPAGVLTVGLLVSFCLYVPTVTTVTSRATQARGFNVFHISTFLAHNVGHCQIRDMHASFFHAFKIEECIFVAWLLRLCWLHVAFVVHVWHKLPAGIALEFPTDVVFRFSLGS